MQRWRAIALSTAAVLLAAWGLSAANGETPSLPAVEARIAEKFPTLTHVPPRAIAERLTNGALDVVLLDAREADEYAVSHIANATRVDPKASAEAVVAAAGDVAGKTVVVYCSVGYRSSTLASAARDKLLAAGAKDVVNLKGGIFAWRNADLPLQSNGARTDKVHGYDAEWAKYLRKSP